MTHEIVAIPCLEDNFAYLLRNGDTGRVALVDAPEAAPILEALDERGWTLSEVWLTHHHPDHVDGVPALKERHDFRTYGAAQDAHRLPPLDEALEPGTAARMVGLECRVIDVPGHTVGHVAFHVPEAKALFSADSLMALGCGRLFEGTPEQMWESLSTLMELPDDTVVYNGHDYLDTNLRFARTIERRNPDLDARADRIDSWRARDVPMGHETLGVEKATNPFLRAGLDAVKSSLDMGSQPDVAVFAEIRRRRDDFS
ncbi:hydroxyacylglutathione hydrolase [Hasllibacter halocynthiae]|uniref:Hydroxyacylglutathione hydrolase n=1 Tax=Hasllibacter halocynthiae TaxID=595589 RepID=A0A2T0X149_9RHOB|nr:hydroxyacylglutathione hydrolase [Hasllibacter halocynthiae]PRY92615.1 hydroxyacylglutathione hydrolase [Hasllibacter halocynthiae]